MKFDSFKENVKQLLLFDCYNELYIFIENYNVATQIHYNTNTNLKLVDTSLAKEIVSLLDFDTRKMLFKIRDFKCYYDLGDLYSLWKIIYIKLFEPIIIIGAGISGLTIASGLALASSLENEFLILEARDRIGGRVYTNEHNMDMGAAWIHGSVNNPLNKFIDYNNMIPVAKCNPWMHSENTAIKYLSPKGILTEEYRQQLAAKWNKIAAKIAMEVDKTIYDAFLELNLEDFSEGYNKGFNESKDIDTISKDDISSFLYMIEVWCGGSIKNISTSFLNEANYSNALFGDYGGPHYLFKNGAKSLIDGILNSNSNKTNILDKVRYNQVVTDIINNDYCVEIRTNAGLTYYCSKLCITVPPGPLKDIKFSPPLDNMHTNSLSKIKMGSYKKIQLEFDGIQEIFDNSPMILTHNPFILWNNYQYSKNKPILEAICPADVGWSLAGQTDEELADNMLLQLRTYYPGLSDPIA
jgi:hypothetical protein